MSRLRRLLRFWFTLSGPVGRRRYFRDGAGLMALKYAVDTAVVAAVTGRVWTPLEYLSPFFYDREALLQGPDPLPWLLVAWTLPFLWIGVSMTFRRVVDAGLTPWLTLLFFVPVVNYGTMLLLCALPTRDEGPSLRPTSPEAVEVRRFRSALVGIGLGMAIILGMVYRTDVLLEGYGVTLFLGTPFVVGAVAAYVHNQTHPRTVRETLAIVTLSLVMGAGAVLLFALEGLLCLIMALPLALPLALLGGLLGRAMAVRVEGHGHTAHVGALVVIPLLLLPLAGQRPVALHEVVTSVEVDAPPEVVWRHVVGFSEIDAPPDLPSRLGIAYPVRARIRGTGVGAVRRCEFSTGAFVEPITVWEPPHRLGFDVVAQPAPLTEWSPYRFVHPPHLDGYFRSRRGEFRLTSLPGGRTRLEGSTFYEMELFPQLYWHLWGDLLIHRIHRRVLRHVRAEAEGEEKTGP